jgi:hypothetical protein
MAEALDDDTAVTGTDHIGAADTHVAGLADSDVGPADIAVAAKPVPAATPVMIAAAAAVKIANDKTAAWSADGKFETDAACIGGRSRGGNAGGGDNESGKRGTDETVHDGISWGRHGALGLVVSVSTGCPFD